MNDSSALADPVVLGILVWFLSTPLFLILWLIYARKARRAASRIVEVQNEKARECERLTGVVDEMRGRFAPILSIDEEVTKLKAAAAEENRRVEDLRASYAEKRKVFDRLEQQVAIYDERLAFAELGVYEPHFDFGDSETYKSRIKEVRERQKAMITQGTATICPTGWTVDGSRSKGQTMVNRQMRLTMRAFNNECEAAIANTRWNNAVAMEKRIMAAATAINRENSSMNLSISDAYVALKIEELRLTHECRERLKAEKEERAELARMEREEKKLLAEAEAAERAERKYQELLDKARREAEAGSATDEMRRRITELEASLAEAHSASERARAMAEMTKSGYVYIISNIGSFGEDVVKIGLTRRLDPDDRVRELGDASVPFSFDTHAMIYSDEAPALEVALHREFADRRINMSNFRKEFFRVKLEEVEEAVARLAPSAAFFKDREAQEWHETLARRNQALQELAEPAEDALPVSI
ncbi:DUF4041 domain-containing protein [Cereibacter azotoformans]|uniref:T5orf172 domain-containing protein n=1 Tax=Cereibacter azotoformans TaxID=43057 RepID=A0A2T5JKF2_9RHOB|nr:DUF4041 domain-containing protein [Cereibacter azotoformans]PTR06946.1 T5orf172 domain-containing protein [Cereibacter azotoformans]UIJ32362.1 DUF4041 domain-containing protein [Cereibacter azotoformans]